MAGTAPGATTDETTDATPRDGQARPAPPPGMPKEVGGPPGPEPTRYGDWQHKGRVSDF
jgi:hypothetical protein